MLSVIGGMSAGKTRAGEIRLCKKVRSGYDYLFIPGGGRTGVAGTGFGLDPGVEPLFAFVPLLNGTGSAVGPGPGGLSGALEQLQPVQVAPTRTKSRSQRK
jgi:hypothetical protein